MVCFIQNKCNYELNKFEPVLNICEQSLKNGFKDLDFQRIDKIFLKGVRKFPLMYQ